MPVPQRTHDNIPSDLKYLDSHEWARVESDGTVTIGISDHAQGALGDLVFVEVPEVGEALTSGRRCGGRRIREGGVRRLQPGVGRGHRQQRRALSATPELVNSDPYGAGLVCSR